MQRLHKTKSLVRRDAFHTPNEGSPPSAEALVPKGLNSGCRGVRRTLAGLTHHETETDLAAFCGGTGFTLGALFRGLVRTEATHLFQDAFHLKFGLETLEGAIYWLAFSDLDFSHSWTVGGLKNGWLN